MRLRSLKKKLLKNRKMSNKCSIEAQQMLYEIGKSANSGESILLQDIISGIKIRIESPLPKRTSRTTRKIPELGDEDPGITGIPTHFTDLDKMINGLENSNLMILAARPAMGKTAFAINIAENVCFKNNIAVGVFSLEMSAEQLVHRLICSQAEVESDKIKTGSLDGQEYQRIVEAINEMQHSTLYHR